MSVRASGQTEPSSSAPRCTSGKIRPRITATPRTEASTAGTGNTIFGVSEDQNTDLITGGFFAVTRNPIYTGMFVTWTGFFLMVPTVAAIVGFVLVALGLEGQVRLVEEPYMRRAHPSYADYERRVGRFFPFIGRRA